MWASLTFPPEGNLISGENLIYIGDMNRGESRTFNWTLVFTACGLFNLDLNASGYRVDTDAYVEEHGYATVTVTDTAPPTLSILSPKNIIYPTPNVSLIFTVSEATAWISYSLDGQANVTITGNTTLTGLPNGLHSLEVYANDTCGNIGLDYTYFTVDHQTTNHGGLGGRPSLRKLL
jgi:hypothetical protein